MITILDLKKVIRVKNNETLCKGNYEHYIIMYLTIIKC